MKKILSLFLMLTLIATCFASVSMLSVSAHQNLSEKITFDEINTANATGYKYGTGNFAREEGVSAKSIEQYTSNGKFTNFHYNDYAYADVVKAPDNKYGMSLGIHHSFNPSTASGANPYVQVNYTSNVKYTGTIHTTFSIYVTEANQYIQRAFLLRSSENSSYRKYPVMFDYGTGRSIQFFGTNTGYQYSPEKWYDFDITYNIDSMEYHIICLEDGELLIDKMGIDGGQKYSYCDLFIFYHGPTKEAYGDQQGYWDNFFIESVNRFEIPKTGSSKEIWQFEDFVKQEFTGGLGMPASPRGTWGLGYQGSTALEIVKSVTDVKTDNMEIEPNLGKSIAFGIPETYNAETAVDGKNDYSYPQLRYTLNSKLPDKFQFAFSLKPYTCGTVHLYAKGSNAFNPVKVDGGNLYVMNTRIASYPLDKDDWYDFDIKVDGATGFYDITVTNRTSPSQGSYHETGFNDGIITYWDASSNIVYFQHSTGAIQKYVYLDNIYFGELPESEVPNVTMADISAEATTDAAGTATCQMPFATAFAGHQFGARLTFEGTAPTVMLGDTAIDVSGFIPGTYPLVIKMMNNNPPEFTVKFDGLDIPISMDTVPAAITLTAPAGEGNKASLTNITYKSFNLLEATSQKVLTDFKASEDVSIEFSNTISEIQSVTVYEPYGELKEDYVVESTSEISGDGKSISISFDKEKEKHYHIAYTVKDAYGATLTDFVEVDTELMLYHCDGIKIYNNEGNEASFLPRGMLDIRAEVSTGDGVKRNGYMWAALYDENGKMKDMEITPVEFDVSPFEYIMFLDVPDDGKAYRVKAGVMAENMAPVAYKELASQVIIFRLDDIKTSTYSKYAELVSWAVEEEVPLSLGMVCNSIDEGNDDYIQSVKNMVETGFVEIWCHGYDHEYHEGTGITSEFTNQTAEYQAEILKKCYDHVYEKTDGVVEIHSLATPSGGYDENTYKALEMLPEYTTFMGNSTIPYDGNGFMNLTNCLWMESGTGVLKSLADLKPYYTDRTTGDYMIFAGHGGYWDETSVQTFKDFVEFLKTTDVAFMTPTQYYNFVN
ncbi:MAG: DUF2334 domain-containing protein [Clostridia bacterium]|nr:DUF2334 domain-containing protein [Clostridia bacterium]